MRSEGLLSIAFGIIILFTRDRRRGFAQATALVTGAAAIILGVWWLV